MQGPLGFSDEEKVPLKKLRSLHPALTHVSLRTLHRWATRGTRGTKLESLRVGWQIMSSIGAVDRYLAALNGTAPEATPQVRSPHQRRKASEKDASYLMSEGA